MKMQGVRKCFLSRLMVVMIVSVFVFYTPGVGFSAAAAVDASGISIPETLGQVKEVYMPSGSAEKLVIHIQDAHVNYGVQKNIDAIIQSLVDRYSVGMVSVEGGTGDIDYASHKKLSDQKMKDAVADFMVKEGMFSGTDAAVYRMDKNIAFTGAETGELYSRNLEVFKSVYKIKDQALAFTNFASTQLMQLSDKLLSGDEKDFVTKTMDYRTRKLDFSSYASFLSAVAKKQGLSTDEWKNFGKLISSITLQNSIDYAAVETERADLLKSLEGALSKDETKKLVDSSLSYRMGKISGLEYYKELKAAADKAKIDLSAKHKNVAAYLQLLSVRAEIDNFALFAEADAIEGQLAAKALKGEALTVYNLRRWADVLGKFPVFQLTRSDVAFYKNAKSQISFEAFSSFLKEKASAAVTQEVLNNGKVLFENLPKMEEFYTLAEQRDEAIVSNTLTAMSSKKSNTAILVAGGYHSDGIKEQLRKANVGYVVISPRVTTRTDNELYVRLMTGQKTSPDGVFVYKFMALVDAYQNGAATATIDNIQALLAALQGQGLPATVGQADLENWLKTDAAKGLRDQFKIDVANGAVTFVAGTTTFGAYMNSEIIIAASDAALNEALKAAKANANVVDVTKQGATPFANLAPAVQAALVASGFFQGADQAALQAALQAQAGLDSVALTNIVNGLNVPVYCVDASALAGNETVQKAQAAGAKMINVTVEGVHYIVRLSPTVEISDFLHEVAEIGGAAHETAAAAQAAFHTAYKEAAAMNYAAQMESAWNLIQGKASAEQVSEALNKLLDFNYGINEATKGEIAQLISDIALQASAGELSPERIADARRILESVAAANKGVRENLAAACQGQKISVASAVPTAIEGQMFIDKATADKLAKTSMGEFIVNQFAGRIVDSPSAVPAGAILFASTEGSADFVQYARGNNVTLRLLDAADFDNFTLFEQVALTAQEAGQIRQAFYTLSPEARILIQTAYGSAIEDILSGKASFVQNLDANTAATVILNMKINSELAAAIKA